MGVFSIRVIKEIKKILEEDVRKGIGKPFLDVENYNVYDFNREKFRPLLDVESRLMAFIDGGNNTILEAPTFSLQVNRLYFNLFKGTERKRPSSDIPQKIEFFSYINVKFESDDKQVPIVKLFPLREEDRKYLPREADFRYVELVGPPDFHRRGRMFSLARRFAEWSFTHHVIKEELGEGDILVRDGSMKTSFQGEKEFRDRIIKTSKRKGVNFVGLSKSCTLSTTTGTSLIVSIKKLAEEAGIEYGKWCYYPIADYKEHPDLMIMAAKLHPLADTIFRIDLLKTGHDEVEVVSAIGENTVDPTFPGYPYGLIDADLNARVRMDELKLYRTRILSALSEDVLEKLKSHIRALDAHEKLNMIANTIED